MWSLQISAGEIAWPYILTTNLEREDLCKTVPFKVAHCRLIGLGDWKMKVLCIKRSEFDVLCFQLSL